MSFSLPILGDIIKGVGNTIDELHTSDEEELKIALQSKSIDASVFNKQADIHIQEVKHPSILVAGARPAIIWVAALGLAYHFIGHPFLSWIYVVLQNMGHLPLDIPPPPTLDAAELMALVSGGSVMGAYRSWDKQNGVDTKQLQ